MSGDFLNRDLIEQKIMEQKPDTESAVITSFKEVSKNDFLIWESNNGKNMS